MAFGLQVWDSGGVKRLDVSDSITRIIDVFTTTTTSSTGSRTYTSLPSGRTWVYFFRAGGGNYVPNVTVSGNSVQWAYASTTRIPVVVYVGAF
jgi:hypothetical protein